MVNVCAFCSNVMVTCIYFRGLAGSFSISVLSGKIMFRDMQWITEDYSVRVQLGLAIFRWWRPLTLKEITEGRDE